MQSQMSEKMVLLVPVVKCFQNDILKEEKIENEKRTSPPLLPRYYRDNIDQYAP